MEVAPTMSPTQPTKRRSGKTNMCPHRLKIFGINFISHSSLRKCLWTYFLHWMNTHQNVVQNLDVGWLIQIALRNMILFSHRYFTVMISWRSRYQVDRIHIWMEKSQQIKAFKLVYVMRKVFAPQIFMTTWNMRSKVSMFSLLKFWNRFESSTQICSRILSLEFIKLNGFCLCLHSITMFGCQRNRTQRYR